MEHKDYFTNVCEELLDISGMNHQNLQELVDLSKEFAISKGICKKSKDLIPDARVIVPFCLFPSSFPEEYFHLVKSIQTDLNYVLHKISYCPEFLRTCLESVRKIDDFISQIFEIYEAVIKENDMQPFSLGLIRSDYMLNTDLEGRISSIKQIENNTIASSFSGLSPNVRELHRFMLKKLGVQDMQQKLPVNECNILMAQGLVRAWEIYGNKKAVILFVVEEEVTNTSDQKATEFAIYEIESSLQVTMQTFRKLHKNAVLKENCLYVNGREVAVVYYRVGYVPDQYKIEDWKLRLLMEKSRAIKCPSAGFHLAGTKTVQMNLLLPGVLERFLPDNADPYKIRQVFAQQLSFKKGIEGEKTLDLALKNPYKYVLKPEREGGGNNIYGENIKTFLNSISASNSRQAYILMEKINPPTVSNCIVRASQVPKIEKVVCELGIFGVILGTKDQIFENYEAGHMIRSKNSKENEGGICAGFAALDSPLLF